MMTEQTNWAGLFGIDPTFTAPRTKRCPETRAHYAHVFYDPLTANCPGGPAEDVAGPHDPDCDGIIGFTDDGDFIDTAIECEHPSHA
jgi:hypothetical protein